MQLDETRVAIRERTLPEIMDLAARVARGYAPQLAFAWVMGALPFALLNAWVLAARYPAEGDEALPAGYVWHLAVLMIWELPLATAPITLYLGQALFVEHPSRRELLRQLCGRMGQLVWYQLGLRGLLPACAVLGYVAGTDRALLVFIELAMCLFWALSYINSPYLNEVLLLERCPWRGSRGRVSTRARTRAMHRQASVSLLGRWLMSLVLAGLLITAGLVAMSWLRGTLTFEHTLDDWTWQWLLPLAGWAAIGYFAIVRFLSYLDLRIRTEGWEVELLLRAEGARLAGQVV